jgi:hypothetical protein
MAVREGEGAGAGGGASAIEAARAGDDTAAKAAMTPKMTVVAFETLRPRLVPLARDGGGAQHMNLFLKKNGCPKMQKNTRPMLICAQFSRAQSVLVLSQRRLADFCCSAATYSRSHSVAAGFPEISRPLANAQISCCNPRHNRIQADRLCVSRLRN